MPHLTIADVANRTKPMADKKKGWIKKKPGTKLEPAKGDGKKKNPMYDHPRSRKD